MSLCSVWLDLVEGRSTMSIHLTTQPYSGKSGEDQPGLHVCRKQMRSKVPVWRMAVTGHVESRFRCRFKLKNQSAISAPSGD